MDNFDKNQYNTEQHNEEIDFIFNQDNDFDETIFNDNRDLRHDLKMYFRLIRKKFSLLLKEKMQKNFTNIVYLTLDCPPYTSDTGSTNNPTEFITEIQKQYPNYDIRILIPIINADTDFKPAKRICMEINGQVKTLERTSIVFEFFLQNRTQTATVYKFPKNKANIQVYGIYSPIFSRVKNISELAKLHYMAPFIKAARIVIKKLSKENFVPDIVHSENIPYYLGAEFETKLFLRTKVLQTIKDFTQIDMAKSEAFWALLNLADKRAMQKLCRDSLIKKYVASLFNLHNTKRFYQMRECLNFIYKNYYKFRKYIDKGEDVEENLIFKRLNARTLQLFPSLAQGEELYYNPMIYTIKQTDFWVVNSQTYYKEIFDNPALSGKMFKYIEKTKNKSGYVSWGCNMQNYERENTGMIYHSFNQENFRDLREKNKLTLLKEFNSDRIKTNFVDPTLFKGAEVKIIGALDSFYNAPLMFASLNTEIFAEGADILFNTILKLFELHKNIQIIICMKDGMKVNFVRSWVKFLTENKYLNGRWTFIDGEVRLPKFLAASDMILIPRRINTTDTNHFIAMHYGCVPVVSRSGILNDTVSDIFDDISNGCGFKTKRGLLCEEDNNELFLTPVMKALNLFQNNPASWNLLVKNCINRPSGWTFEILEKYHQIYQELI